MLRINCPFCGERDHSEFTYGGDATVVYPALDAPLEAWIDAVYVRRNPKGLHRERWQHGDGCRLWLIVERDVRKIFTYRQQVLAEIFPHTQTNCAVAAS